MGDGEAAEGRLAKMKKRQHEAKEPWEDNLDVSGATPELKWLLLLHLYMWKLHLHRSAPGDPQLEGNLAYDAVHQAQEVLGAADV